MSTKLDWNIPTLPPLAEEIFRRLKQAVTDLQNPWRLPVLSTIGPEGPDARVVVLREASDDGSEYVAYSDLRSAKVEQLRRQSGFALVFYDPVDLVQLRIRGLARIVSETGSESCRWLALSQNQRKNYQSIRAPGEPVGSANFGEELGDSSGLENFAVIFFHALEIDWLWLARTGHRRAFWVRRNGEWSGTWRVP